MSSGATTATIKIDIQLLNIKKEKEKKEKKHLCLAGRGVGDLKQVQLGRSDGHVPLDDDFGRIVVDVNVPRRALRHVTNL